MSDVLIIGCGDIGRRVARLELARGSRVHGTVRLPEQGTELERLDIQPVAADLDQPGPIPGLPTRGATVYYFAPPPGGGDLDTRVRVFCGSVEPGEEPAKIVYISTSGVYGDTGAAWVDETTPANPRTARARRRLDAETILGGWGRVRGVAVIILRVTGIYGPGRFPLDRLRQGQPVLREEEAPYTNRIHAEDLARVCLAAADRGEGGDIFNVSDGRPGTMTEYFNAVADAFGLPRPPQIPLAEARRLMSPLMLSYISESRRLSNRRMMEKLGVKLLYPSLLEGMRGVAATRRKESRD